MYIGIAGTCAYPRMCASATRTRAARLHYLLEDFAAYVVRRRVEGDSLVSVFAAVDEVGCGEDIEDGRREAVVCAVGEGVCPNCVCEGSVERVRSSRGGDA